MRYWLHFADSAGHPLTLLGRKEVRNDAGPTCGVTPPRCTSRSSGPRGLPGAGPDAVVVGAGILRLTPLDLVRQLATLRAQAPTAHERVEVLPPVRPAVPRQAVGRLRAERPVVLAGVTAAPDLVVVGSGFGGAVVAMRAAEAGLRVLVLERGREYLPASFPRDPHRVQDVLWRRGRRRSDGLYDVRLLSGLGVVSAAGVGGGSLVFAGVLVQPGPEVFASWPEEVRAGLEQAFDAVREVLRPAPLPAKVPVPKRDLLTRAAGRLGRTAYDPPLAIGWDADSAPGGVGCALDAACELGCSVGAKRSLDVTYLARARRAGAQVLAQAEVTSLARDDSGGYLVHYLAARTTGRAPAPCGRRGSCSARGPWAPASCCSPAGTAPGRCPARVPGSGTVSRPTVTSSRRCRAAPSPCTRDADRM
jgi:hypothetical protein